MVLWLRFIKLRNFQALLMTIILINSGDWRGKNEILMSNDGRVEEVSSPLTKSVIPIKLFIATPTIVSNINEV